MINGNRNTFYSHELASMYEEIAHDLAINSDPFDFNPLELDEFERMEWLAEIWDTITYTLHGKWYS